MHSIHHKKKRRIYLLFFLLACGHWACHPSIRYPPGGYDYPVHVAAKDTNFYFYPVKDKESRLDSFAHSFFYLFYGEFHEPNLSMHSQPATIFRLTYSSLEGYPFIISLSENGMIIKQGSPGKGFTILKDTNRLTSLERMHLRILDHNFPIEQDHHSVRRKHYLDSLGVVYPQLHDPTYYRYLLDKVSPYNSPMYTYTGKKIPVSSSVFDTLVNLLNTSGFWHLPLHIHSKYDVNDGLGFSLEANTSQKYNIVFADGGGDDSSQFNRACQELVDRAKLDRIVHLVPYHDPDMVRPAPIVIQDIQIEGENDPVKKKVKKK